MKQLVLHTRIYDRETSEYIQRFLAVELTDHEAKLFEELKKSIDERTPALFPFKEKGWCDDDEILELETPLTDLMEGEPEPTHRFSFAQGLYTEDTEDDGYGCGWCGM